MDILEANFPTTLTVPSSQVFRQRFEQLEDLLAGLSDEPTHFFNQEDLNSKSVGDLQSLRRVILDDLKTIERLLFHNITTQKILYKDGCCEDSKEDYPDPDDCRSPELLVSLRYYLEKLKCKVTAICAHRVFRHKQARHKFLKSVSGLLTVIENNNAMWGSFESAVAEVEMDHATDTSSMPSDTSERSYKLRWNSYCRSKAFRISDETIALSERKGTDIPARVHRLPTSTFTILEHWRMDVNDLVDALLQVNDSDVVREQIAKVKETYWKLTREDRTNKVKAAMNPTPRPHPLKYKRAITIFASPCLTDAANFLERVDRSGMRMQGMRFFDLVLRTFYDVPGMRAVEKKLPSVIVDSGLRL